MPEFQTTLEAARRGERSALDELFDRFYPTVRSMVHRSLATDLRSQRPWLVAMFSTGDVVQDVFQSVLRDLDAFEGDNDRAFVGYLAAVVRNRLLDAIRFHQAVRRDRRRIGSSVDDLEVASDTRGPAERLATGEEMEQFCRVLASFPSRERLLLRERLEKKETFKVLAEQLGYPSTDAARKAFYTAQARLLVRLKREGVDSPDGATR